MINIRSIPQKVIFFIILIIIMVSVALGYFLYFVESRRLVQSLNQNSLISLERLNSILSSPFWAYDYDEIYTLLQIEMENRDLAAILLFSVKDKFIAGYSKQSDHSNDNREQVLQLESADAVVSRQDSFYLVLEDNK